MAQLTVYKGDITTLAADAIVNAANTSLLGGGGVDGAIHRAAGPELLDACRKLNGCKTGEAKITPGFLLPAGYVIHAVGPVWRGGNNDEALLLANAYRNSLQIAVSHSIKTIAFPNISTGVYNYPKENAATVAIKTVKDFCESQPGMISEVFFACFDAENYNIYVNLLQ
ncbi:MAG: O-acetyl-ADP-ribose deacetylase [Bacteroidetes bacterium 46-16]|nr:MAG: O-acetyl-ADP-ribose deacetylase [Bacteroidetes bacterium 46-16]